MEFLVPKINSFAVKVMLSDMTMIEKYQPDDFPELISSLNQSHAALVQAFSNVPSAELDNDRGIRFKGYKVTIARTLEAEIADEGEHREQIEAYFGKSQRT